MHPTSAKTPGTVLALDIGGTTTRAALLQCSAGSWQIVERREAPTPRPGAPERVLDTAAELAEPLATRAEAVGIACAGAVADGKVTATAEHTFPGWKDIPLAERLSDRLAAALGKPCVALNDARAAAWGEYVAGAGQSVGQSKGGEFMFITVSTGVGAGLVLGGRLHLAGNGLDAELGFVSVPAQWQAGQEVPGLGYPEPLKLGPLEFETSGTALGFQAQTLGLTDARALCDAAEAGDERAEAAYLHSAGLIAWKIADIAALLGVTRVALGGSVGLRPGYLARVRAQLAHFPPRYQPEVVHAKLGADAGLVGAALWAQASANQAN